MSVEFNDGHPGQTFKYQSWLDTDLGTVIEGLIDKKEGASKDEPMEDSEEEPTGWQRVSFI